MTTKPPEVLYVPEDIGRISCNGGDGALGHPKVWYSFDGAQEVTCGYCDRLFTRTNQIGAKPYKSRSAA